VRLTSHPSAAFASPAVAAAPWCLGVVL
jgi:hypothetical protein